MIAARLSVPVVASAVALLLMTSILVRREMATPRQPAECRGNGRAVCELMRDIEAKVASGELEVRASHGCIRFVPRISPEQQRRFAEEELRVRAEMEREAAAH